MHNRYDQFSKLVTREGCAPFGHGETDAEVSPDAMREVAADPGQRTKDDEEFMRPVR